MLYPMVSTFCKILRHHLFLVKEREEISSLRVKLKEQNRVLKEACELVAKISGRSVDSNNLISVLEGYLFDPNQSVKQMTRIWGEGSMTS